MIKEEVVLIYFRVVYYDSCGVTEELHEEPVRAGQCPLVGLNRTSPEYKLET